MISVDKIFYMFLNDKTQNEFYELFQTLKPQKNEKELTWVEYPYHFHKRKTKTTITKHGDISYRDIVPPIHKSPNEKESTGIKKRRDLNLTNPYEK